MDTITVAEYISRLTLKGIRGPWHARVHMPSRQDRDYTTYLRVWLYEPFTELPVRSFLALRHGIQRLGSLVKPLDAKNSCSPAVKVKVAPQSGQVIDLSVKLMDGLLSYE